MNSEELELSLRTEFENYLKDVFAGMRQDVAEFHKTFEAEFEKHKSQMDEAFRNISARFESDPKFDAAFRESVVEHLRLARDDGAQLTAQAMSEAEKLAPAVTEPARYDDLRDAVNEITGQTTQSAILRSLVDRVSHFTPRGAFFIVKHDNFVCWRRFDRDGSSDDESVRKVHFPIAADTLLAEAVNSLSTQDSASRTHAGDSVYLDALDFGRPDQMFAIPLTARGRGVAVLYAARGENGEPVNLEAIESLVRVAGLTVELRATSASLGAQPAPAEVSAPAEPAVEEARAETQYHDDSHEHVEAPTVEEYTGAVVSVEEPDAELEETASFEPVAADTWEAQEEAEAESEAAAEVEVEESPEPVSDFAFASSDAFDASAEVEAEVEPEPVEEYAYASDPAPSNGHAFEAAPEPVVELAASQPAKSRLSDRNVDLPIDVPEDERRFHNDARRFARLLVSEIKLYNEQKVSEGRDAGDLYDRLREAIDRSREMYDKRVKPQVAAKFDYFHYELTSNLAEGNVAKLGGSYPGATV